ncbi:MAG: ribonuclease III family protein [Solirubrobacterales bacterium]
MTPDPPTAERSTLAELIGELPPELRERALTHATWTEDRTGSYERLAYLGDSVLALAVAADLIERFPTVAAGGLTKIHNQAVSGVSCAAVGRSLAVPEMLRAAQPDDDLAIPVEVLLGGARALPEVTEALIGACFLTFGFERTAAAVVGAFELQVEGAAESPLDFKSALQELLAQRRARVSYEVVDESGPAHRRTFEVEAIVDSERVGRGRGRSKKVAEQAAAEEALERIRGRS